MKRGGGRAEWEGERVGGESGRGEGESRGRRGGRWKGGRKDTGWEREAVEINGADLFEKI